MKTILVLLMISTLGMANDSQWIQYKKACQKSGGKAYQVKSNKFECKKKNHAKDEDNHKISKKKTVEGPKFKDGISAMMSAEF